jgi:thiamine monophosphate kinase
MQRFHFCKGITKGCGLWCRVDIVGGATKSSEIFGVAVMTSGVDEC